MTSEEIIALYRTLVGDSFDGVAEYQLLNQAKDQIEDERNWAYLKKLDSTQTFNTGDTYQTLKTLPSDFGKPMDSGIFVGSDTLPYTSVPFEQQIVWNSLSHRYYLDMANNSFGIFGNPVAGPIHFFYQKTTPTLTALLSPLFPSRFHPILAYKMAQIFFSIDQGEKSRAWDDRWTVFYNQLLASMINWDAQITINGYQNASSDFIDHEKYPNIVSGIQ